MHFPRTYALVVSSVGLLVLAGCGSEEDDPAAGTAPTAAGVETPTDSTSDEPADDATDELPEIPSDLPTDIPTDLDDLELGDCEDLFEAVLEATEAMEDVMSDPEGVDELFAGVSAALREESADSSDDIKAAAEELAAAYDEFGVAVSSGDLTDMTDVDLDRLTQASTDLQEACLG